MSSDVIDAPGTVGSAAGLRAAFDAFLRADLVGLDDENLLAQVREFEEFKRCLPVGDHLMVAEVEDRRLAHKLCLPNTATLLARQLRLSPGEARARVVAAANLGPRRSLVGESLPPLFARVAAAQAEGSISPVQAAVITHAYDRLPYLVQAEHGEQFEAELVARARVFDPTRLRIIAQKLHDCYDPDGSLTEDADHARRRDFGLVRHRDGSATPTGCLTPGLATLIDAFLDEHAEPRPAVDGVADPRTAGQRRHDALEDGLTRLVRGDAISCTAGATLILTMTAEQFTSGQGHVTTPHGGQLTIPAALELVSAGELMSVVFDPHGGILSYGRSERLVPRQMRLALTARDRGCTFPGCDRPPAWCEAHHFWEWDDGGPTAVDTCGLVCRYHHREFQKRGWRSDLINGRAHWTPPAWIDPTQTPRINNMHDPPLRT